MSDLKPSIYGFCPAGCKWETMHKTDILAMAEWTSILSSSGNLYYLEKENLYRIYPEEENFILTYNYGKYVGGVREPGNLYFTFPELDPYKPYYDFVLLAVTTENNDNITFVYEINGVRKTEIISDGTSSYYDDGPQKMAGNNIKKLLLRNEGNNMYEVVPLKVFIRYANDDQGRFMGDHWVEGQKYIGTYVGETASESPIDYEWCKFIGDDGEVPDAVLYSEQTLTDEQKAQARTNIGVTDSVQSDWNQTDDTQKDYIKNKPTIPENAVLYSEQTLTDEQKAQARTNIGASSGGGGGGTTIVVDNTAGEKTCPCENGTEYRYLAVTSLILSELTAPAIDQEYITSIVFVSLPTPTTFTTTTKIYFTGDACDGGVFTPAAKKRYELIIWFNGWNFQGTSRGASIA